MKLIKSIKGTRLENSIFVKYKTIYIKTNSK